MVRIGGSSDLRSIGLRPILDWLWLVLRVALVYRHIPRWLLLLRVRVSVLGRAAILGSLSGVVVLRPLGRVLRAGLRVGVHAEFVGFL